MALVLKEYQAECLRRLEGYLGRVVAEGNPAGAFFEMTHRPYLPVEQLGAGMPYVCLRVPTGGGKTLLAAHAIKVIARTLLRQERALVLWLAPRTVEELVAWLARSIQPEDLRHAETSSFLLGLVKYLMDMRGLTLPQLLSARYVLWDAAARRIDRERRKAMRAAYQFFLLPSGGVKLEVTAARCFEFPLRSVYPAPRIYSGPYQYSKHYYQNLGSMNEEEAKCAVLIDSDARVKFWVRNLTRHDMAFWLPTSTDRFYPDFVAMLNDGRYLVVEYKGAHIAPEESRDSAEKQEIGRVWEERSGGRCIFRMVTMENMAAELAGIG